MKSNNKKAIIKLNSIWFDIVGEELLCKAIDFQYKSKITTYFNMKLKFK